MQESLCSPDRCSWIGIGFSLVISVFTVALASAFVLMFAVETSSAVSLYSTGHVDKMDFTKASGILNLIGIAVFMTTGLGWWKHLGLW